MRDLLRTTRRLLGLSPMRRLLRRLGERGVDVSTLHALELFGGSGTFHTVDYATRVASLEVWEIDPRYEKSLRRHLPSAHIRLVDSFTEIDRIARTFDMVVVDNPMSTWDGHCEHFDLFPSLFRLIRERSIIVLNVIPFLTQTARERYPYLFNREQVFRRAAFYRTTHPEEVSFETMMETYARLARTSGFHIEWSLLVRRHFVYYLAMQLGTGNQGLGGQAGVTSPVSRAKGAPGMNYR